jgi:hypothetical protein
VQLITERQRPRTDWADRLLTWGMAIAILVVAFVGFAMLASVRHPPVGVAAAVFAPPPGTRPTLLSPRLDSPLPSIELGPPPASAAVGCARAARPCGPAARPSPGAAR